jgi:hypothetical protein
MIDPPSLLTSDVSCNPDVLLGIFCAFSYLACSPAVNELIFPPPQTPKKAWFFKRDGKDTPFIPICNYLQKKNSNFFYLFVYFRPPLSFP